MMGEETVWFNSGSLNNQDGHWRTGYSESHKGKWLMDPAQIGRIPETKQSS